jgi:RHS repeat-associated protein
MKDPGLCLPAGGGNDGGLTDNPYQYNGKELHADFGLGWYAYGARYYDPVLGRFTGVDPISDQFPHVTTYNYAENEPVAHIDLWGLQKYKPQGQRLEKPEDLASIKMLHNLWEGTKTMAVEFDSVERSGLNAIGAE